MAAGDIASGEQPGSLGSLYLPRQASSPFRQQLAEKEPKKWPGLRLSRVFDTLKTNVTDKITS